MIWYEMAGQLENGLGCVYVGGWRLHRTETSYLGDRYWLLPLGPSGVHDEKFIGKQYRVSQNKETITKKS